MTTYSHTIVLDDTERIALEAALRLMIKHCDEQIADGQDAPYLVYKESCEEVWSRLVTSTPRLTSTNSFSGPPPHR